MHSWVLSDESDMLLWVCDLDNAVYEVTHRRMCAWFDELTDTWKWEIVTYEHSGVAASGTSGSEQEAKSAAEDAALKFASIQGGRS